MKAYFGINNFQPRDSKRFASLFKQSMDPTSIVSISAKLWEKTSEKFKSTNLIKNAAKEAQLLVNNLPI